MITFQKFNKQSRTVCIRMNLIEDSSCVTVLLIDSNGSKLGVTHS